MRNSEDKNEKSLIWIGVTVVVLNPTAISLLHIFLSEKIDDQTANYTTCTLSVIFLIALLLAWDITKEK